MPAWGWVPGSRKVEVGQLTGAGRARGAQKGVWNYSEISLSHQGLKEGKLCDVYILKIILAIS